MSDTSLPSILPPGGVSELSTNISDTAFDSPTIDTDQAVFALSATDQNFKAFENNFRELSCEMDFLLNMRDIAGQMIVTRLSTWYYDDSENLFAYPSLQTALNANPDFEGRVNYMQDMELTGSQLGLSGRKLTIDLRDHTISCNRASLCYLAYGTELTVQNGNIILPKFYASGSETKFAIYHGHLTLKNVNIDADAGRNDSVWSYRMFNMSQTVNELTSDGYGRSQLDIESDCSINMYNANLGECMIVDLGPYYILVSNINTRIYSVQQFWEKYGTGKDIMPIVNLAGNIRITRAASIPEDNSDYPTVITENGSDHLGTEININDGAKIFTQGHGIYLGNAGSINIKGNDISIIGRTGITMRSGTLNIPEYANPVIIGIGDYQQYDIFHGVKDGSDWGLNLNLGHAVILENNGTAYGGKQVSADIRSGTFISYNNTAIGSYSGGRRQNSVPAEMRAKDENDNDIVAEYNGAVYFAKRPEFFADCVNLNRRESAVPYDYLTGDYPDYNIAKDEKNKQLNAVKFENGRKYDLSNESGMKSAVKDMLTLLGVDEQSIS